MILTPSLRLARPAIRPGWDDAPADRPRGRSRSWRRLLAGAAGLTRLQPGTCCGCGGGGLTCTPCALPLTNLTLTWTPNGTALCSGSITLVYTPSFPPNLGTYWLGSGDPSGGCCNPGVTIGISCGTNLPHTGVLQWFSSTTLVCEANEVWVKTSCSPLHMSMTTAVGESNHCGGNCSSNMDQITFTVTS